MDSGVANSGGGAFSFMLRLIFVLLSLVALYYIYKFLFTISDLKSLQLNGAVRWAGKKGTGGNSLLTVSGKSFEDALVKPVEGSTFSVQGWFYVKDYTDRKGVYKHLLSIGGNTFDTIIIMLGQFKNSFHVRVNSEGSGPTAPPGTNKLDVAQRTALFDTTSTDTSITNEPQICDINNFDLNKWIHYCVVVDGKTVDVYMNGKLARSCLLPFSFKVDSTGFYGARMLDKDGFSGYISRTEFYNYNLGPDQVWRFYMDGPGEKLMGWDYFRSLFDPKAVGTLQYPKVN